MADLPYPQANKELTQAEVSSLYQLLQVRRASIMDQYRQDVRAGQDSLEEGTEDLVDKANMAYNRELLFSLSDNEREQLQLVDDALDRLENGDYGLCQHSDQPIPKRRLEAVPWARYRAEIQELAEKGLLKDD